MSCGGQQLHLAKKEKTWIFHPQFSSFSRHTGKNKSQDESIKSNNDNISFGLSLCAEDISPGFIATWQ